MEKMVKAYRQHSIGELAQGYEETLKQRICDRYEEIKKLSTRKITVQNQTYLSNRANLRINWKRYTSNMKKRF